MAKVMLFLRYAGQCKCRPRANSGASGPPLPDEASPGKNPSTVGQREAAAPTKTAATKPTLRRQAPSITGRSSNPAQITTNAATSTSALRVEPALSPQTSRPTTAAVAPQTAKGLPCRRTANTTATSAAAPL